MKAWRPVVLSILGDEYVEKKKTGTSDATRLHTGHLNL